MIHKVYEPEIRARLGTGFGVWGLERTAHVLLLADFSSMSTPVLALLQRAIDARKSPFAERRNCPGVRYWPARRNCKSPAGAASICVRPTEWAHSIDPGTAAAARPEVAVPARRGAEAS